VNRNYILGAAILVGAFAATAQTAAPADHGTHHPQAQAGAGEFAQGEVRKVDKAAGKITLRHGEIRNLDMPAMTMCSPPPSRRCLSR
jgi:Cu(I)/Ag(I) efflux system periplasmic protein CusF